MEILFWGLGAIGFWIFFGLVCLILIALVEHERVGWSTLLLLGTLLFFQLGTSFKPFSLLVAHPGWGALTVLGYFLAGAAWCVWKWWFFVKAARRRFNERKRAFLEHHSIDGDVVPDRLRDQWHHQIQNMPYDRFGAVVPMPSCHKGRIMTWMIYWPWSFVWTIVDDPIKRMFRAIYDQIKSTLEAISRSAFQDVEDELAPPNDPTGGPTGGPRHGQERRHDLEQSPVSQAPDFDALEDEGEEIVIHHGQPAPDIAHSEHGFVLEDDGLSAEDAEAWQETNRPSGDRSAK